MEKQLTLGKYIDKNKTFVIPHYQRGYVWGKGTKEDNAVTYLLKSIKEGYAKSESVFLQGITVSENENSEQIILIDGQQRTTFLYLVLCYLESAKGIHIKYEVREESEKFLTELQNKSQEQILGIIGRNDNESFQDLFFFKRSLRYIHEELKECERDKLIKYLLNQVNFLYINIPIEKAVKTFTMMNGSKAKMLVEELIKAEMLRQISLAPNANTEDFEESWETNALRSRYAREWDKWLHWWRRPDVSKLFRTELQLGWLLECFAKLEGMEASSFESFKTILKDSHKTKLHFKTLRKLQKSFEDVFNNPITHNWLGISMLQADKREQYKIIDFFITHKQDSQLLADFAKWKIVGATHDEITEMSSTGSVEGENEPSAKIQKALNALDTISQKIVYKSEGDLTARKYLLYLNVLEDNKANNNRGRKFNFSIFDKQSLEHIHPKSKAYHYDEETSSYFIGENIEGKTQKPVGDEWLDRNACPKNISEHSIGNLVLLEVGNNSTFGNKSFSEKKSKYFDLSTKFESRELLHTISVFANEQWGIKEIVKNQENILNRFHEFYGV